VEPAKPTRSPPRGVRPKPPDTPSDAPEAPKAPLAPKAPKAPKAPRPPKPPAKPIEAEPVEVEPSDEPTESESMGGGPSDIESALQKLREYQEASAQLAKALEEAGHGDAARALLARVERAEEEDRGRRLEPLAPPPAAQVLPRPAPPVAAEAPPAAPVSPGAPGRPAPPLPPKPPTEKYERGEDSMVLQGSRFHVPLGGRLVVFKVLWDEWIRAGIGKERGVAGIGEVDDMGRPRGPVLSEEDLRFLPQVQVIVPGRDGSLLIPPEIMVDFDKFETMLDQWGVGDRITIEVEGMIRAEGPVAKNTWYAGLDGDDFDQ
jgi:hypothetical protein